MKTMTRIMRTLSITMAVASILLAAEPNFTGTWKLNLTKSQLSGTVYTIEKKASGMLHYSGGGFEADFDLTGKEQVMPSGVSIIGKELSPTSWELTFRMNGKALSKSRLTVNGNSMTLSSDITSADGQTVQQTSTDTRISGGPGFIGKWKSGETKGASTTLQIATEGANGITLTYPEFQQTCKGSFDGKDYPVIQGGQPTKFTNAFAKTGTEIKITTKLNGKPFAVDVYTLSADGKSLTDDSTATATNEKTKSVYDRQ
jgi:hypothetical protein